MLQVGFEPRISLFQRADMVHDLDRAAIVIGSIFPYRLIICEAESVVKYIKNYVSSRATH
jgi:hypothetical protein